MNKKSRFIILLIFLSFAVTCNQDPTRSLQEAPDDAALYQIEGELPSSTVAREWIADAVVDLASRLSVDISDVAFIAFNLPVWPDASYGCPQPDQTYDATSKEGYRIQLRVNGRDYFYHGGEDIEQFLCESE